MAMWAVAFLDLLGYRTVLDRFDRFPLPEDDQGREELSTAFAHAVKLRRRLLGGMQTFTNRVRFPSEIDGKPIHPELARLLSFDIHRSPGPDHIVLGTALVDGPRHNPMRGVFAIVASLASAMMIQCKIGSDEPASTLPLRGGIDVAPGCVLEPENVLYSPGLTRAYDLERAAEYPRVIAGERFIGYLDAGSNQDNQGTAHDITRMIARGTRRMFFKAEDGKWTLDFYGEAKRGMLSEIYEDTGRDTA